MEFRAYDINSLEKTEDEHGYVRCSVGKRHPFNNKGMVLAHRLVMESHLGRYLDTQEVIHHINEVKTDNRLHNLYLCTQEEHTQIHNRYRSNSLAKRGRIAQGVSRARNKLNQKAAAQGGS